MADRWIPDGTQPAKPLPLFPDPVAGLITGVEAGEDITGDRYDLAIPIAKPVEVDREAAQAMLHAVMDDPEPPSGPRVNLPPPRKTALPTGAAMPGMVAPAERLPARQRMRNAMAKDSGQRQSSSNLTGWIVALILLLVFGAIAVSVIASIIEAIGGAFD